jgi:cell division protein FtsN
MARDYKGSDKRPAAKRGHPMMTGILIGVLVGLVAALAVALYLAKTPNPVVAREKPPETAKPAPKPGPLAGLPQPSDGQQKPTDKRFEFYEILPGKKEPKAQPAAKPEGAQAGVMREVMYLQAAAFPKPADADNLKARLALAGLEAQIQTYTSPDNSVWHRVRLGPFTNAEDLEKVRATLRENKIEPKVIKEKEPLAKR